MQKAKDEIRQGILDAAKEEFLTAGFEKASIRTIAARAGTAKSNLYNYFPDKDALFCAVLAPTVDTIRRGLTEAEKASAMASGKEYEIDAQRQYVRVVAEFSATHAIDLTLLLFRSAGSSLMAFREEVIGAFAGVLETWLGGKATKLLLKCVAGFYAIVVEQMLLARPTRKETEETMNQLLAFVYGGWSGVLRQLHEAGNDETGGL